MSWLALFYNLILTQDVTFKWFSFVSALISRTAYSIKQSLCATFHVSGNPMLQMSASELSMPDYCAWDQPQQPATKVAVTLMPF